jgi:hypothetical protein
VVGTAAFVAGEDEPVELGAMAPDVRLSGTASGRRWVLVARKGLGRYRVRREEGRSGLPAELGAELVGRDYYWYYC